MSHPIADAAVAYANRNIYVFPQGCDKRPLIPRWPDVASTDPALVRNWFLFEFPSSNVACVPGRSGLIVVDIDRHKKDGFEKLAALEEKHGKLPETVVVESGGGGRHYYYKAPASSVCVYRNLGDGVEIVTGRHAVTLPPSIHASGKHYRFASDAPLAEFPTSWAALAVPVQRIPPPCIAPIAATSRYACAALEREVDALCATAAGGRNAAANRAGFSVGQLVGAGLLAEGSASEALVAAAMAAGLGEVEARAAVRSGMAAGMRSPRTVAPRAS
jgi:hypothetical protein